MSMGDPHMHENSKDSEATRGIYDILHKGEKGDQVLDCRSEKG